MTISILGLYNYNSALFDKMKLPEGISKELVIDAILSRYAELEILYPNWNVMQYLVGSWSAMELDNWERINAAMTKEYDPISNYDRTETWEDEAKANGKVAAFNAGDLVDSSSGTSSNKRTGRAYGNIGVTTSQQMLEAEIKLRQWCIYDHIAESFKRRFCLLVY